MDTKCLVIAGWLAVLVCFPAQAATMAVDAKTVIFAAGGNSNPDPQGIIPGSIPLPAGSSRLLSISAVTGSVTPMNGSAAFGPDGGNFLNLPYTVLGHEGIAGIRDSDIGFTMPLAGVFTAGVPLPSARPPDRNVTSEKELALIPTVLHQPFFIGDGMTSTGIRQFFAVPEGATHFSFGFADAIPQFGVFNGPPGAYSDNSGSLTVTYSFIPEPSAAALLWLGLALGGRRKRVKPVGLRHAHTRSRPAA